MGPDISPAALAVLIGHPDFDIAMIGVARRLVDEYRASWLMNRILSDRDRMVAAYMALDLYFTDPARRGFTLAQLRLEAERHGFASRGRMTAWTASLRVLGMLAPGAPGRPQRLVPTLKFLAMFRTRMDDFYQCIGLIHPVAGFNHAALERDGFVADLAAGFAEPYHSGQRILEATPELATLADREAGVILLMSIKLKEVAGEAITIADLAREFIISRAHVRSVLHDASALGLVARPMNDGVYLALPRLTDSLRRLFAVMFQAHIFALERAMAGDTDIAAAAAPDAR